MYTDINTTVTDSDRNVFQQLMDRAYDRWVKYDDEVKAKREQFRKDCLALCPIDGDVFQGTMRYQHNGEYITDYAMDDLVWKTFPMLGLDGFYASCDKLEIVAVILGNFNYQTENGGISQWRYNGYAKAARGRVKTFLKRIGTPTCLKVIELLAQARGDYRSNVSSTQFYKINDQMIADINAWLIEQVNKANTRDATTKKQKASPASPSEDRS